eukprot:CAMPEP_0198724622 /NCGR_PEP_ID=MMETSP1475-20131203/2079_1 /TAXON_ID= ORGANISM="Unidentified sp., Strain CCMP1999" /NCGR_SAMPLE_ID=MMETSP1475 /ASSEMBLY_ACC=CAM_ASM_001111 /LENGTH=85 /DNA_ID=CAMNT_0044486201 /DNA_START=527 /DNA_END=781 /DNA_ORIENTATION=+
MRALRWSAARFSFLTRFLCLIASISGITGRGAASSGAAAGLTTTADPTNADDFALHVALCARRCDPSAAAPPTNAMLPHRNAGRA